LWQPWPAIVVMLASAIAVFWGVLGILQGEYFEDRARCLGGLAAAGVAIALAILAIFLDPARRAEQESLRDQERWQQMSQEELMEWRKEKLGRYIGGGVTPPEPE
jgi:hypothetical protein